MTAGSARLKAYKKGARLERLAALYLTLKGYKIMAMRYKTPMGEIDIIAKRGNVLVFAEVKGRAQIGAAIESVHERNRARIEQAARHFTARHPQLAGHDMRFDILVFAPPFSFRHLDNAWQGRT